MDREDLLRPTLSDYRKPPELYGSTGFFLSAFIGGPLGAGVYAGANAWRLGRLARDLPVIVAIVAATFLALLELHRAGALDHVAEWLGGTSSGNLRIIIRGFGLATYGAIYFMHRSFYRSAQVAGTRPMPGWAPGLVAVAAGMAANIAFATWILEHR